MSSRSYFDIVFRYFQGDKVTLLRRLNENWYEGRLKNLEGIFPATYVETLREPKGKNENKIRFSFDVFRCFRTKN